MFGDEPVVACNTDYIGDSHENVWHASEESKPEVEPVEENVKPLVPIVVSKIGDQEVNSISARELYLDLGFNGSNWSRWSKENILENQFVTQGVDFIELVVMTSSPNPPKDYAVSIEMAKHIAMMAKTQRAHDYRNYFIECEKVAKAARGEATQQTIAGKPLEHPQSIDWLEPVVLDEFAKAIMW